MKSRMFGAWVVGLAASMTFVAGCGDDEGGATPAADAAPADGAADASPVDGGAAVDAPPSDPKPVSLELSKTLHDRLFGVTWTAAGLFATGVIGESADDLAMVVVKLKDDGTLDTSFGAAGVAKKNVIAKKAGEVARGIVVQSTGKIVIAGTIEHEGATDERDRDLAVVRFNADGSVDTSFGAGGVVVLDLSAGELVGTTYVADAQWGLSLAAGDALVVTGAAKATGRTDTDFAVVRLKADGSRDTSFGTNGVATVDIDNQSANMRTATVLADGGIVGAGYYTDADKIIRPAVFKLKPDGALDASFGKGGIFNDALLPAACEAYGAALQGTSFVTIGYGRASTTESLDWLSFRVKPDGTHDKSFGAAGLARLDLAGQNDNGRALLVLPDERILLLGGGRTTAENSDGMIALLTKDGQPDPSFGTKGIRTWDFGGPSDFFWGAALSPDKARIALVGVKGQTTGGAATDDAVILVANAPK
jgi:uncharacterized delta-60 repeat protein